MSISPTPGLLFFFSFVVLVAPSFADDDSRLTPPPFSSPPQPPTPSLRPQNLAPFRPSIAVIVAVLTTMFSVTFLLLLYAKHCKHGSGGGPAGYGRQSTNLASAARKNSGIDRTVIESLPLFRFGSLRGHKDGLECAVCLARFETTELLRLLPKCKHAFHVECVDTWLDAHSTCPLCRYRVDPEDILLIDDCKILHEYQPTRPQQSPRPENESKLSSIEESSTNIRGSGRVSGRHSSAGEKVSGFLEIVVEQPRELDPNSSNRDNTVSLRRSLDSSTSSKKKSANKSESVTVGCFDRQRKDGLLLADEARTCGIDRSRLEHRITISGTEPGSSGLLQRWSDVHPSDMLYLRSEMIINDSRKFSSSSSSSRPSVRLQREGSNGRSVINSRSVSEITGLKRYKNDNSNHQDRERQAGVLSRWLAWISHSQPAVRSDRGTTTVSSV